MGSQLVEHCFQVTVIVAGKCRVNLLIKKFLDRLLKIIVVEGSFFLIFQYLSIL